MDTLYERIIRLCNQKGIKGGKMCVDLGMSKGTLTDLKMGRQTGLSAAKAQKIASYLGVSVGYLLGEEENTASEETIVKGRVLSEADIEFFEWLEGKSEDDKRWLLGIIKSIEEGKK